MQRIILACLLFMMVNAATADSYSSDDLSEGKVKQSLASTDESFVKLISALMASDEVLKCHLDMTLLGAAYREFYYASSDYVVREDEHISRIAEYTMLLVNSEEFSEGIRAKTTCEELLSTYGDAMRRLNDITAKLKNKD